MTAFAPDAVPPAPPASNGHGQPGPRIAILVVAPPSDIAALAAIFRGDARFQLVATATSADDARAKLSLRPEVVLVDTRAFADLEAFAAVFGACSCSLFVILPPQTTPAIIAAVQEIPAVRQVITEAPNLPALAGEIYAAMQADRHLSLTSDGYQAGQGGPRSAMVGWRCIAVWSLQGGTGRSTLATALALEAAERRLPTLLVGLGAPDVVPLRLGFSGPEPNLLQWAAAPTAAQLKLSVRQFDVLDVLAGFPEQSALDAYLPQAMQAQQGIPALANTAAHAGYAVVVLDVSAPEMAAPAISAANTLLLTTLPTPDGILAVGEASRMVSDFMGKQHSIPLDGVHLLLNRVRDSMLAPAEFMRSLNRMAINTPPLAAVIPDDPRIDMARTQFRPAYHFSEPLRQAMQSLGDMLFAPPPGLTTSAPARCGRAAKVWRLGPLRIRR